MLTDDDVLLIVKFLGAEVEDPVAVDTLDSWNKTLRRT